MDEKMVLEVVGQNRNYLLPFEWVDKLVTSPVCAPYPNAKKGWYGVLYIQGEVLPLIKLSKESHCSCVIVENDVMRFAIAVDLVGHVRPKQEDDELFELYV